MPLRRELAGAEPLNGTLETEHASRSSDDNTLDMIIVGAGFAGIWLLNRLRQQGFNAKIVEACHSQYPVYALSLPEVYDEWTWSSHYPDHNELRAYFKFVDERLHIKRDCIFNAKVTDAVWDDKACVWSIRCDSGQKITTRFWTACTGFAAKRYFPDWPGYEDFEGTMFHSSFWPKGGVDVRGKRVAVIGTGATGVQITQEWCREIGEGGDLKMFQRTPNLACPMNQVYMTKEEQKEVAAGLGARFADRNNHYNGFLYQWRENLTYDHTPEEREEFYRLLWKMGGFRFLMNNYYDMTRNAEANQEAYNFWRDRTRERVKDPKKAELLAPMERPHLFGGKRLSLEQDFYDQFNRPNVDVIDVRTNPIDRFVSDGVVQKDGTHHKLDMIALATGFDSITGGLKDMKIAGIDGELMGDKWAKGTWTYLGLSTARFPNFFFTYGPQAPTAFSNGPSCIEIQGDWIADVLSDMRDKKLRKIDADPKAEAEWKDLVNDLINDTPRGKVDSWYNGANIPGKPREHLNYAGGIPRYKKTLEDVRAREYEGFHLAL
ncbi:hypothetical protein LTR53_008934 [Teratosphaeriaceae sp. CCFEE 6253]|nr:hypothetical protein LTR53_008934 [Teratosphaeriaceae sp. CCFEE 6253]